MRQEEIEIGIPVKALPFSTTEITIKRCFNQYAIVDSISQSSAWITFRHGGKYLWPISALENKLASTPKVDDTICELEFGNNLKCKLKVTNNKIEILAAMNGWGDAIPLSDITLSDLTSEKEEGR